MKNNNIVREKTDSKNVLQKNMVGGIVVESLLVTNLPTLINVAVGVGSVVAGVTEALLKKMIVNEVIKKAAVIVSAIAMHRT